MITNWADNDFLFRTTPHTVIQGQVLGVLLRERGYERLAILYVDDDYGTGLANAIQETFGLLGGVITAQIAFEPSRPSYRDVVQAAAGNGAEALVHIPLPKPGAAAGCRRRERQSSKSSSSLTA